ncbi:MAG: hypothetical protein ABI775_10775, partial [Pseudonocardiales bacterium]
EFADGQNTLTVRWSEATIDDTMGGVPVPRDPHVIANGSVAGSAYAAFFGIPQAKVARQQVISFILLRIRDDLDVTAAGLQITMRGAEQTASEPFATPDPDAIGVLTHAPADVADPVLRDYLLPFGTLGGRALFWNESFSQSAWSRPDVPLLIFADDNLGGRPVTFHDGPLGTGLPIQLIYWGEYWNSPDGSARRAMLDSRTQALLASSYYSELDQYGVAPPRWRGSIVATQLPAPSTFASEKDIKQVKKLTSRLLDDDVFPDPDEGRIGFVVLMPNGFTTNVANGAHSDDWVYDFPLDKDNYWLAWIRYFGPETGEDPEQAIQTISHEIAEMTTDPEPPSGWCVGPANGGEIGDASEVPNARQTAWVNGANVEAYWSNRHSATVIPIDRDYAARISSRTLVESTTVLDSGTFRPDPAELAFCGTIPECCIPVRDYTWQQVGRDELAVLRVETARYHTPKVQWKIQDLPVSGTGSQFVHASTAQRFNHRDPVFLDTDVQVHFEVLDGVMELRATATATNFDVTVSCEVTDGSFTGNLRVNVIATPSIVIGFVGAEISIEQEYTDAHDACGEAARAFFKAHEDSLQHTPLPGEPNELNPGVIAALPAFARTGLYFKAHEALILTHLAAATLPATDAIAYLQATKLRIPILQIPLIA